MAFYDYIINLAQQKPKSFIEQAKETLAKTKQIFQQFEQTPFAQKVKAFHDIAPLEKYFPTPEEAALQEMKTPVRGYGQFVPIGSELKPSTGQEKLVSDIAVMNKKLEQSAFIAMGFLGLAPIYQGEKGLTTKFLEYVKGKTTLSKQEILDFAKRPELKKGEADLLNRLGSELKETKIPAQDFADSIRRDLLELKPVKVKEPQYSRTTIDEKDIDYTRPGRRLKNYEEVVFESPITTNGSPVHYPNSKNYFAHARGDEVVEGGKKIWREQEIQSDLLQKEGLENLSRNIKKQEYQGLSGEEITVEGPIKVGTKISEPTGDFGGQITDVLPDGGFKWTDYDTIEKYRGRDIPEKYKTIQKATEKKEIEKLTPFTNDRFGERIMRERIKEKASKGYEKYRLPTGETIGKIEGFVENRFFTTENWEKGIPMRLDEIKTGREIVTAADDHWIITDILGDGRFKAVPKKIYENYTRGTPLKSGTELNLDTFRNSENYRQSFETFDLTGKSNPQYRRYSDWGKFLKNKFGGKEVTDPQGNSWIEIDLKPEYKKEPVEAFGRAPSQLLAYNRLLTRS